MRSKEKKNCVLLLVEEVRTAQKHIHKRREEEGKTKKKKYHKKSRKRNKNFLFTTKMFADKQYKILKKKIIKIKIDKGEDKVVLVEKNK